MGHSSLAPKRLHEGEELENYLRSPSIDREFKPNEPEVVSDYHLHPTKFQTETLPGAEPVTKFENS